MNKIKIGAQLFTLRKFLQNPDTVESVFEKVKSMGYKTVQVSGMCQMDPARLAKISRKTALSICITHSPYKRIKDDLDKLAEEHLTYGCKVIGLGMMPKCFDKQRVDDVKKFVDFMNVTADKLAQYDMRFSYHNHCAEFKVLDGKLLMDRLIDDTDKRVLFTLDTYWIKVGGYEPTRYIDKLSGRLNTIHLKDYKKKFFIPMMKPIGEGTLDFKEILAHAETSGCQNAVVELDVAKNPYEALNVSAKYLDEIYGL